MLRRFSGATFLVLFLIASLASSPLPTRAQETTEPTVGIRSKARQVFALHGARIVISPGREIESGVLIVEGEKLTAVGTLETTPIPPDAIKVDLTGHTIYPGFIDAYTEIEANAETLEAGAPYWNSNIRPQLLVSEQIPQADNDDEARRETGLVARLAVPDAGIIKGVSALVSTSDLSAHRRLITPETALHIRLTARRNSGDGPRYPNSPMGAVALARQAMLDGQWYDSAWTAVGANHRLNRPERNDALEALQPYLRDNGLVVFDGFNELYALRADRFAREFSLRAAIHGSGNEYRRLSEVVETGRPVIVPLNFPQPPDVATPDTAAAASLESLMHWDLAPENPGRLDKAGVKIAFTTEGLKSQSELLKGVRKAIQRGLSNESALAALTINPATLFEAEGLLGTLETGKLASFVITDGDLFDAETNIVETWVTGERYEHETASLRTPAGHWAVEIASGQGKPASLLIELTQKENSKSIKGSILASAGASLDEPLKLSEVQVSDTQLTASFNSSVVGERGVSRLSAVLTHSADGKIEVGMGSISWADGTRSSIRLTRTTQPENESSSDTSESSTETTAATETTADAETASAKSETTSAKPSDTHEPRKTHSFDVNYPLGAFGVKEVPTQSEAVLFQNATVWSNSDAGILPETDVLVRAGKIVAVGQDLDVPSGAMVVDATGMHLTPGIIDCHSHMATDGGVNESGQAITAEVRIGDFIDCDDITIYRQLAGGVTSSNILHGSANPIGGQNQVIKLRWGANDEQMKFSAAPQGIKFALGENVKRQPRSGEGTYPRTRMGVEQLIRDELQAAEEYVKRWKDWNANHEGLPPRRDLQLEAMAEILAGERWIHCHSYRQDEILALIRTLDDYGITIGTFQHILEGYKVADVMAKHGAMASAFSDWWAYKVEVYDAIPHAGAIMHQAGVVVSFNSDDGELATHLNLEAAKAVKYGGVPAEEALKFVTLNPAKQLRIDDYVGSIEVGKHADIVLWNGDPLSNFSRCEQTWIEGVKYFDREADQESRKQVAMMRNKLIQKILDSGESMLAPGEVPMDPSRLWPREDLFCHGHDHDVERFHNGQHDHTHHE